MLLRVVCFVLVTIVIATAQDPGPGVSAPAQGTPAPAQGTPAPAQGTPPPAQGTPAPAQGTPVPAQGTPFPAQGTPPPAQGAPPPAQDNPAPVVDDVPAQEDPTSVQDDLPSQDVNGYYWRQASCLPGWVESKTSGTCIKVYDETKSWGDARAVCQAAGGDLVKIVSESMNDFIWDQVSANQELPYWIGLHDQNGEGMFEWLDEKAKAGYVNWANGQPNNRDSYRHKNGQDCVEIGNSLLTAKEWNDQDCEIEQRFICEKPKGATVAAASCSPGWIESKTSGTCIKLYDATKYWAEARAVCQAAGGDLVKIVSESMNDFIWDLVSANQRLPYWIGLHDQNGEGMFEWLDEKAKAGFVNWANGQPNNRDSYRHKNGQDCVEIGNTLVTAKEWNDQDCNFEQRFICEKPKGATVAAGSSGGFNNLIRH